MVNLGRKSQRCPFCRNIGTQSDLEDVDFYSHISFQDFQLLFNFWTNLGRKSQSCPFYLKINTQSISRMLILIPALLSWISNPNSIYGQISSENVARCRRTQSDLEDVDFYSHISFQNFQLLFNFWTNLGRKSQSCPFCLRIGTHGISRMLILLLTLVFWISNSNSIFGQIWAEKVKVVHFVGKLARKVISRMLIFIPTLILWNSKPKPIFMQISVKKIKVVRFFLKISTQSISRMLILIPVLVS